MNSKLLLVNAITLLFKESLLENKTGNSADLVKNIVNTLKIPEVVMDGDRTRDIIVSLRSTALWMADNSIDYVYDKSGLHQRIRVNVGDEENLYLAIAETIDEPVVNQDSLKSVVLGYRDTLNTYLKQTKVTEILREASKQAMFNPEQIDWTTFVRTVCEELDPFTSTTKNSKHPSVVSDIDISDIESVADVLTTAKEEIASEGVLRTGFQAMNRMLGDSLGFRRGEFVLLSALQHNFKSGMMLKLLEHFAMYNKPYMRDPNKKPMLMRISYENEVHMDLLWLYADLKEAETGQPCDIHGIDPTEAGKYVQERLGANGYHINMCRIDPTEFTFYDLFDRIDYFESQGYEIHALFVDYLSMQSKRGCTQGTLGSDTRDLFRRVRNFTSKRGITFITPHQLSSEAKQLTRNGAENFVQDIANKGYYDGCKALDQEVDVEIHMHIVKVGLDSYLTLQRGKHRKVSITNPKDLYTVLKFHPVGGIHDDINGKDLSMKYVGGSTMAEGGEKPWFG